MKFVVIKKEN